MKHDRKTKMITIVVLIVIAFGLSIGFAVYSRNLNIQNVQASVTGDPTKFDVEFSTASGSLIAGSVVGNACSDPGDVTAGTATLKDTTISNLTGTFRNSGEVNYQFYVYNKGSVPAYLTGITFGGKTCTGVQGTSNDLVQAACENIVIYVFAGGKSYTATNTKITDSKELSQGKGDLVVVRIVYSARNAVDGDFTTKFGDITLIYSSQKPSV